MFAEKNRVFLAEAQPRLQGIWIAGTLRVPAPAPPRRLGTSPDRARGPNGAEHLQELTIKWYKPWYKP